MSDDEQERRLRMLIEYLSMLLDRMSHAVMSRPSNYELHDSIAIQARQFLARKRESGELKNPSILREMLHGESPD